MSIITDMQAAQNYAMKANKLTKKIALWFQERYGCNYSDVDCGELIDAIDYALGPIPKTIAEIDELMLFCGKKPK